MMNELGKPGSADDDGRRQRYLLLLLHYRDAHNNIVHYCTVTAIVTAGQRGKRLWLLYTWWEFVGLTTQVLSMRTWQSQFPTRCLLLRLVPKGLVGAKDEHCIFALQYTKGHSHSAQSRFLWGFHQCAALYYLFRDAVRHFVKSTGTVVGWIMHGYVVNKRKCAAFLLSLPVSILIPPPQGLCEKTHVYQPVISEELAR